MITRSLSWSPDSTQAVVQENGGVIVSTNGRGAPVWVPPYDYMQRYCLPHGGPLKVQLPNQKLMVDPSDPLTWGSKPRKFDGTGRDNHVQTRSFP